MKILRDVYLNNYGLQLTCKAPCYCPKLHKKAAQITVPKKY